MNSSIEFVYFRSNVAEGSDENEMLDVKTGMDEPFDSFVAWSCLGGREIKANRMMLQPILLLYNMEFLL